MVFEMPNWFDVGISNNRAGRESVKQRFKSQLP
jgi:hypothetical protein